MDTGTALLKSICDNPTDDTVRLIYADYLLENNKSDQAEYIQLSLGTKLGKEKAIRKAELFKKNRFAWCPFKGLGKVSVNGNALVIHAKFGYARVLFSRGFPYSVTINWVTYFDRMNELFELNPITDVRIMYAKPVFSLWNPVKLPFRWTWVSSADLRGCFVPESVFEKLNGLKFKTYDAACWEKGYESNKLAMDDFKQTLLLVAKEKVRGK